MPLLRTFLSCTDPLANTAIARPRASIPRFPPHYIYMQKLIFWFEGYLSCFQAVVRQEGLLALWRGSLFAGIGFATIAPYYYVLAAVRVKLPTKLLHPTLTAILTEACATIVFYPFYRNWVRVAGSADAISCLSLMYRGLSLYCAQELLRRMGVYFGASVTVQVISLLLERRISQHVIAMVTLAVPFLLSVASTAVCYPLSTVLHRMLLQPEGIELEAWECATTLVTEEGIGGLYCGVGIEMAGLVAVAVSMSVFQT